MQSRLLLRALAELGMLQVGRVALYRALSKLGYWRLRPGLAPRGNYPLALQAIPCPSREALQGIPGLDLEQCIAQAQAVCQGQFPFFGVSWRPLDFTLPETPGHWTQYEHAQFAGEDIKFTWEPARFCWTAQLARAFVLTGDGQYPQAFWRYFQAFEASHPAYQGPNWVSAQEVGIRMTWLIWAAAIFQPAWKNEPGIMERLAQAVASHAWRIAPTLLYARAQDNNHLLVEAAALYTAGIVLPGHPAARQWRSSGWRLFHEGIHRQVSPDGTYMQQSTNYHRMMLQIALWVAAVAERAGQPDFHRVQSRLAAATQWLLELVDWKSGQVPNLGANDGSYLFPLGSTGHADYRPVLQAACQAWTGSTPFPPGLWDEMAAWFQISPKAGSQPVSYPRHVRLEHPQKHSWAYLRTAQFRHHRPGHADLLHLDLWWQGINLAGDPGTCLYNGAPPWQNPWTTALVHNTVSLNGRDQMERLGRFLYVGRASAWVTQRSQESAEAAQDSYHRLGVAHQRKVTIEPWGWSVVDTLKPLGRRGKHDPEAPYTVQWNWLLPDWNWVLKKSPPNTEQFILASPFGEVILSTTIETTHEPEGNLDIRLYRAGECLVGGHAPEPLYGWRSSTYAHKTPALMLRLAWQTNLPCTITTRWELPADKE